MRMKDYPEKNDEDRKNADYEKQLKDLAKSLGCSYEALSKSMQGYNECHAKDGRNKKKKYILSNIFGSDGIFSKISTTFVCSFINAKKKDLRKLKEIGLPEIIIQFYKSNEPVDCNINGIQIHDVEQVIAENTELCPGWVTAKYGYYAFASNDHGDAFCFDVNTLDDEGNPRIAYVSHEAIWDESSEEEVHESVIPVAKNLYDFFGKLCKGEIEESYDDD